MNAFTKIQYNSHNVNQLIKDCYNGEHLRIMPAAYYSRFAQEDLSAFCVAKGLYCLPTIELLDKLNELILEADPHRNAIEIGAGNGAIARGLGIPATDSMMQSNPSVAYLYETVFNQPTVEYGSNVQQIDGNAAVEKMRPDVVVGAWVTHIYDNRDPERGGNVLGIDEWDILRRVKRYIVVGNTAIHGKKPIMGQVSQVIKAPYLFSRSAQYHERNAIFVWDNSNKYLAGR